MSTDFPDLRLAVLSDVHGNVEALRAVADHLKRQSVDAIVNLGDCVSAPLWPSETFSELASLHALTVRGNHDRWLGDAERRKASPTIAYVTEQLSTDAVASLVSLPPTAMFFESVLAVHGTPTSDTTYLLEEKQGARLCLSTTSQIGQRLGDTTAALVLCGHSHQQHAAFAPGGRLVVNPGSVGCPRYADNDDVLQNEAGSPHARYAVVTRRNGHWSADLFVVWYDWRPVVERARAVGREDWATSFLHGTGRQG